MFFQGCSERTKADTEYVLYKAKDVVSLSEHAQPSKENAVLVKGEKIVSVGQFDAILKAFSDEAITINDQFSESVFVSGFINQHDHPWLGALTLNSAIISIEDWDLPTGFYPKASTAEQYLSLLRSAVQSHSQGDELFLS